MADNGKLSAALVLMVLAPQALALALPPVPSAASAHASLSKVDNKILPWETTPAVQINHDPLIRSPDDFHYEGDVERELEVEEWKGEEELDKRAKKDTGTPDQVGVGPSMGKEWSCVVM